MVSDSGQLGRRAVIVVVSVASLVACCLLAWWQWERFSSAGGSFQNLGYVLQWPLFGLFPAFMFWRIRRLRQREAETAQAGPGTASGDNPGAASADDPADSAPTTGANAPVPAAAPGTSARSEPIADEDDELAAYNRYLAELNAAQRAATEKGRSTR